MSHREYVRLKHYRSIFVQAKLTLPYLAGPGRGCCAAVRLSTDVYVWHKPDRPPGWWRFLSYH